MSTAIKSRNDTFSFSAENTDWARSQIAKYPQGRQASAVMPLLTRAQEQNGGHLSIAAVEHVANFLDMPEIRVLEVASFYSMYALKPRGRHVIEICTTTPCWLRGSAEVVKAAEDELGITIGETTDDGEFSLREVECLGACVNAPMCSIHLDYYEDLDGESMRKIIRDLRAGKKLKAGPQIDRQTSAPVGGATTLTGAEDA